jgi:hypothetical protein
VSAADFRAAVSWFEAEAEVLCWDHARKMFWTSTGPERRYWAAVWRRMIREEKGRLLAGRVALHATYLMRGKAS